MKLQYATFIIFLIFTSPVCMPEEKNEDILSITEERRRTLQYGIDSEIEPLLDKITQDKNEEFAEEAADLFTSSLNTDIKNACIEYLQTIENDAVAEECETIIKNYDEHPVSLVKSSIAYVGSVREKIGLALVSPLLDAEQAVAASAIRNFSGIEVDGLTELLKEKYRERDSGTALKAEILLAFGKLKDESTLEMLQSIAGDDAEETTLRHYACSALGELGDPGSLDVLIDVYGSDEALTRSYALYGISKIDNPKSAEIVLQALRDSFWKIRVNACEALGEKKLKKAVPALQYKAERDPEFQVRTAAVKALAEIGGKEALDTLYKLFENDQTNSTVRISAFESLVEHHFDAASGKIKEVFEKELSKDRSDLLDTICRTLSMKKSPNLTDFYRKMLDHGSITVKIHALRGIERNAVGQLKSEVEKLADEDMPNSIRRHALKALESL